MYVWMCEFSFILKMILEFSQWNPCTFGILLDKLIVLRCEKCVTAKVQSKFYLVTLSLTYTHKYTDSIHMHWKMKNRSFIKTHRKIFVFISIVWWMFMSCFSFAGSQIFVHTLKLTLTSYLWLNMGNFYLLLFVCVAIKHVICTLFHRLISHIFKCTKQEKSTIISLCQFFCYFFVFWKPSKYLLSKVEIIKKVC